MLGYLCFFAIAQTPNMATGSAHISATNQAQFVKRKKLLASDVSNCEYHRGRERIFQCFDPFIPLLNPSIISSTAVQPFDNLRASGSVLAGGKHQLGALVVLLLTLK